MPKIMVAKCEIYCSALRSIPEKSSSLQISLATKDPSIAWAGNGKSSIVTCFQLSQGNFVSS